MFSKTAHAYCDNVQKSEKYKEIFLSSLENIFFLRKSKYFYVKCWSLWSTSFRKSKSRCVILSFVLASNQPKPHNSHILKKRYIHISAYPIFCGFSKMEKFYDFITTWNCFHMWFGNLDDFCSFKTENRLNCLNRLNPNN